MTETHFASKKWRCGQWRNFEEQCPKFVSSGGYKSTTSYLHYEQNIFLD